MRIYEINKGEKCYWREYKKWDKKIPRGYWSAFPLGTHEKQDFFFYKALVIWFGMRILSDINAKLELSKLNSGKE